MSVLLSLTLTAQAMLIEVIPGGFPIDSAPPVFYDWLLGNGSVRKFFDDAQTIPWTNPQTGEVLGTSGWVSLYGELDGGVYFFTNLIAVSPTPIASVSWDFSGSGGYNLTHVHVWGRSPSGIAWENLYQVPFAERFVSHGTQFVQLDGSIIIRGVSFYGLAPGMSLPDGGPSLLGIALVCMSVMAIRRRLS